MWSSGVMVLVVLFEESVWMEIGELVAAEPIH